MLHKPQIRPGHREGQHHQLDPMGPDLCLSPTALPHPPRTGPGRRHLLDSEGRLVQDPTRSDIEQALEDKRFFWLNLTAFDDEEAGWLRDLFHFHPLAIEDAVTFDERPKIEEYDDHVLLVLYGSSAPGDPDREVDVPGETPELLADRLDDVLEVHCFVSARFMITIDRGRCDAFVRLAHRLSDRGVPVHDPARLFHRVADILVDSFFPGLARLDDRIDDIETELLQRPRSALMGELLRFRRSIVTLRRVITPMRDMFASLSSGVVQLPGLDEEALRYYRDVYDHLIRLSDMIDGYRDVLSGATDAYLSVTSNQLNVVMKQLAIISTIFLPLSFLTGFFGQNFGWLVNSLGSLWSFVVVGLGTEVLVVIGMLHLFRTRGWLGGDT